MTIGAKIKQARINHGWTQEELGRRVGVQKSAIAKWETGRVENIKRSSLMALAEALEISPVELIGSQKYIDKEMSPAKAEITELIDKMNDDQLSTILSYIRFIKHGG